VNDIIILKTYLHCRLDRESTEAVQVKRSEFQENTSQKVIDFQKKLDQSRDQVCCYLITATAFVSVQVD